MVDLTYLTAILPSLNRSFATTAVLVASVLFLLYKYYTWHFNFFKSRGVPGPKPVLFFGNSMLFAKGFRDIQLELVNTYGKVLGFFQGRIPGYWIADTNIIKQILVKEFSHFSNRRVFPFRGEFENSNVFDSRNEDWRRQRHLLTPVFTSGKMRQMNSLINEATDDVMTYLDEVTASEGIVDVKDLSAAYVMDVIVSVAFGMKTNSHKDKDNGLVAAAKNLANFDTKSILTFVIAFFPELVRVLAPFKITTFPKSSFLYMKNVTETAIKMRKNDPDIKRIDFLKLMLDAHDAGDKTGLSGKEIFGNSALFLTAGYETTAATISWLLIYLATNPDVQDKLHAEIDETMEEHPTPSYDSVQSMPYLEMCIEETLRRTTLGFMLEREASEDITIDGVFIRKGMIVQIPIYYLHHDPDIWDEPMEFRPERFTPEAKASRDPYVYLPFGQGPRNCLGMRLAQMEMKIMLTRILHRFKFTAPESLRIPIPLKADQLFPVPEDGFTLKIEKR